MKKATDFHQAPLAVTDTHCHLDYLLKERPLEEILHECDLQNVKRVITIAVSSQNLSFVDETTKKNDHVFGSLGIHPHEADNTTEDVVELVENLCKNNNKIVAIGEIGLDYYYNKSTPEKQKVIFSAFLKLASRLNLPVIIHSRDADHDMAEILRTHAKNLTKKGVIHSFTSSPELAKEAIDLGMYLGFNGIITFKNAQNVRDVLLATPLERIVVETDAPFLTPIPFRGRTNFPYLVPLVAKYIAELKGVTEIEMLKILERNTTQLFFTP
jgi:TatD DNase family protein